MESAQSLIRQIIKVRMSFRQNLQCALRRNNIDMTFEMLQIMNRLWCEQGVSQQELACKTAKDKACMTGLMSNLEKRGWVVRKDGVTDKRNRLVYLTPEGEAMNGKVRPLIDIIYADLAKEIGITTLDWCTRELEKIDEILSRS